MTVENYLIGYKDLKIIQDPDMFNFSLDSVLLPNFVTINSKIKRILDIGCGNAPMPLILSTKTEAKIIGVEYQKEIYNQAKKSVSLNNLDNQIEIVNADIKEYYKELESDTFDIIISNPPYFKVTENSHLNKNDYKTIARHEINLDYKDVMKVSKKLLKNDGVLAMVHRPERLIDIILEMRSNNIEPKKMRLVYPGIDKKANILLIEGSKNGKPGLSIMPPLYSHNSDGSYTEEIQKYFS